MDKLETSTALTLPGTKSSNKIRVALRGEFRHAGVYQCPVSKKSGLLRL